MLRERDIEEARQDAIEKAEQAKQREKQMKTGGPVSETPSVTAAEVAAVELDMGDVRLLAQLGAAAEAGMERTAELAAIHGELAATNREIGAAKVPCLTVYNKIQREPLGTVNNNLPHSLNIYQ